MTPDWKPLYDLQTADGSELWIVAAIGGVLGIVALTWYRRAGGWMPLVLGGFAVLWLSFGYAWPTWQRSDALQRLSEDRVSRAEGPMTDYRQWSQKRSTHKIGERPRYDDYERFSIDGVEFTFQAGYIDGLLRAQGQDPEAIRHRLALRLAWVDLELAGGRERTIATIDWALADGIGTAPANAAVVEGRSAQMEQIAADALARNAAAAAAAAAQFRAASEAASQR